jgi:hypothetical protein
LVLPLVGQSQRYSIYSKPCVFILEFDGFLIAPNSVICRTKYPSPFPNYLIINSAQCTVSIYVPHILVKYIFLAHCSNNFYSLAMVVSPPTIPNTKGARYNRLWFGVTIKYIVLVYYKAGCKRVG